MTDAERTGWLAWWACVSGSARGTLIEQWARGGTREQRELALRLLQMWAKEIGG